MIALRELGGAVARVPADATAFAHRDKAARHPCQAVPAGGAGGIKRASRSFQKSSKNESGVY